jgi:hypothetical protein
MVIYRVIVQVEVAIEEEWVGWMRSEHIPEVMNTGFFVDTQFARVVEPESAGSAEYCIEYRCRSAAGLEAYRNRDAARLQAEHTERYRGQVTATRTVLTTIDLPGDP